MKFSVLLCLFSSLAIAQHNNRSARDLQFRFGNPGARSLAFGGAFIGLADDATAPVVNPAGMALTQRRSVSLEVGHQQFDHRIPFQSGSVTQTNLFEFDFNLQEASTSNGITSIPYAAIVIPRGQWRFSFFYHQQANIEREFTTDEIQFQLEANTSLTFAYNPSRDFLDMKMDNLGASIGSTIGSRVHWGVSLFGSALSYTADSTIFLQSVAAELEPVHQTARGDDEGWGAIAGLIWQMSEYFSSGIVYKMQPEFDYTAALNADPPNPDNPNFSEQGVFEIPDSLGVGFSIRPSDRITLNADAVRIYYSQITDALIDFTGIEEVRQSMSDVTEIHLGFEWAFPDLAYPFFLRLGYWLDPYHAAVNNIEDSQLLRGTSDNPRIRDIFFLHRFEEDVNHYAIGTGFTFSQDIQLDAGMDFSDRGESYSISSIYRF